MNDIYMKALRDWMLTKEQSERKVIVSTLFSLMEDGRNLIKNLGYDPSLWTEFIGVVDDIYHETKIHK